MASGWLFLLSSLARLDLGGAERVLVATDVATRNGLGKHGIELACCIHVFSIPQCAANFKYNFFCISLTGTTGRRWRLMIAENPTRPRIFRIARKRASDSEQRLKAGGFEVLVVREGVAEAETPHDRERDAIHDARIAGPAAFVLSPRVRPVLIRRFN